MHSTAMNINLYIYTQNTNPVLESGNVGAYIHRARHAANLVRRIFHSSPRLGHVFTQAS